MQLDNAKRTEGKDTDGIDELKESQVILFVREKCSKLERRKSRRANVRCGTEKKLTLKKQSSKASRKKLRSTEC